MRRGGRQLMAMLMILLALPWVARADDAADLRRAQTLAAAKHFADAERIYRDVLRRSPRSREAEIGLARVVLWQGRYREARNRFLAAGDREGAATAAYWQGDFRTAVREFRALPESAFARESAAAIASASRGTDRLDAELVDDDQPFRSLRTTATASFFSDPLTRWNVSAGFASLDAPRLDTRRQLTRVAIANETVFPWTRITAGAQLGLQRYPDRSTHAAGGASIRYRASAFSSATAAILRRELLTNATGLHTHPFVTAATIAWQRYAESSWVAGAEAGSLRYFDRNRGRYLQGYALLPITHRLSLGASAASRDTSDNRFYLEALSATRRSDGAFDYAYRGSYTPYWTPRHFREARAIALTQGAIRSASWKLQLERGVSHDTATAFGPANGVSPSPAGFYAFDFRRSATPSRAAFTIALPVTRYRIECTIERSTTAFYAANAIHASLVRQR